MQVLALSTRAVQVRAMAATKSVKVSTHVTLGVGGCGRTYYLPDLAFFQHMLRHPIRGQRLGLSRASAWNTPPEHDGIAHCVLFAYL